MEEMEMVCPDSLQLLSGFSFCPSMKLFKDRQHLVFRHQHISPHLPTIENIVLHNVMGHPHSTHLCEPTLKHVLFSSEALSERKLSSTLQPSGPHIIQDLFLSLLGGDSFQQGYELPFRSCDRAFYATNHHLSLPLHLFHISTILYALHIMCSVFVFEPQSDLPYRTSMHHYKSYLCSLHRQVVQSISDSI